MIKFHFLAASALVLCCVSCSIPGVKAGWIDTGVRFDIDDCPETFAAEAFTRPAWKGDKAIAEFIVNSENDIERIEAEVSDLSCGSSVISGKTIELSAVDYTLSDVYNYFHGTKREAEFQKDDSVLVADVISPDAFTKAPAGVNRPFWLSIDVPSDAAAGTYTGFVTIKAGGPGRIKLPITLQVVDRVLPDPHEWSFHLDLWQNPYSVAVAENVELWSDAHFEAMRPLMTRLAKAGQKVITATLVNRPWNGQTYVPFGTMVKKTLKPDGSWSYDWTIFDKWVEFMISCGIDRQISCYTMVPWGMLFDYYDEKSGQDVVLELQAPSEKYSWYWSNLLTAFTAHLQSKGWLDIAHIAMDERKEDVMRASIGLIHEYGRGLGVSLAGKYNDFYLENVDDMCILYGEEYPESVLEQRTAAGRVSTFYTCCVPRCANTFTISPPAEAEFLGWYAASQGLSGYLRWAYNSWNEDPAHDSRYNGWNAGDSFLVFPGNRSSVRFEKLCEGIRAYEKIRILKQVASPEQLKQIEEILAQIDTVNMDPYAGGDAAALMNKANAELSKLF